MNMTIDWKTVDPLLFPLDPTAGSLGDKSIVVQDNSYTTPFSDEMFRISTVSQDFATQKAADRKNQLRASAQLKAERYTHRKQEEQRTDLEIVQTAYSFTTPSMQSSKDYSSEIISLFDGGDRPTEEEALRSRKNYRKNVELALDIANVVLAPASVVTEITNTLVVKPICWLTSPLDLCPVIGEGLEIVGNAIADELPNIWKEPRIYGVSEKKIQIVQQRMLDTLAIIPIGKAAKLGWTKGKSLLPKSVEKLPPAQQVVPIIKQTVELPNTSIHDLYFATLRKQLTVVPSCKIKVIDAPCQSARVLLNYSSNLKNQISSKTAPILDLPEELLRINRYKIRDQSWSMHPVVLQDKLLSTRRSLKFETEFPYKMVEDGSMVAYLSGHEFARKRQYPIANRSTDHYKSRRITFTMDELYKLAQEKNALRLLLAWNPDTIPEIEIDLMRRQLSVSGFQESFSGYYIADINPIPLDSQITLTLKNQKTLNAIFQTSSSKISWGDCENLLKQLKATRYDRPYTSEFHFRLNGKEIQIKTQLPDLAEITPESQNSLKRFLEEAGVNPSNKEFLCIHQP